MKNTFDGLISSLDTAKGRINKLEVVFNTIFPSCKAKRRKHREGVRKNRIFKNQDIIINITRTGIIRKYI